MDSQGNAQAFALNIKVYSDGANTATFKTASNSYVTKQAVKQWFRVWKKRINDAGYSMKDLGPYGRVFKPRLNASDTTFGSGGEIGRGEWNYSDIVTVAPQIGSASITAQELVDQYSLHLMGSSVREDTGDDDTVQYTSVGMISSWLGSRRKTIGQEADNVPESLVFNLTNPLLMTRQGDISSKRLLDEVRDLQKDEAPYDEQDFDSTYTQALVKTNADLYGECDIIAPCGLVEVTTTAACTVIFTLVGIGDM